MKKYLISSVLLLLVSFYSNAQNPEQIQQYIAKMSTYAMLEMQRSAVPASISLAQGILETAAGTSPLYSRSYNNFGIKCKSAWKGPFTYHDDDAKGECFRVYDNDSMSYVDHSNFLRTASRYDFLFKLPSTDYKGWAFGLKKAGYATNPAYSKKLIEYIETYNLAAFDNPTALLNEKAPVTATAAITPENTNTANNKAAEVLPKQAINLPAPVNNESSSSNAGIDPENIQIVHWNVTNVPDATSSYTAAPSKKARNVYRKYPAKKAIASKSKAVAKNPIAKTSTAKQVAVVNKPNSKKAAPSKATAAAASKNNRSTRL
jgi:hypothetical protein